MADKANVFDDSMKAFLDKMISIEFLARYTDQRQEIGLSESRRRFEEAKKVRSEQGYDPTNILGLTLCLSIPDVTKDFRTFKAYGRKGHHDDEFMALIDELGGRAMLQVLVMVYETLEAFLKEFAPHLFFARRDTWKLRRRKKFHAAHKDMAKAKHKNTDRYFAEYVKYLTKNNCNELLSELRAMFPAFDSNCQNNLFFDLFSAYRLLACIRHAAVHGYGEPVGKEMKRLSKEEAHSIKQMTKVSRLTGSETILPHLGVTTRLLDLTLALVYCLYVSASTECSMKVMTIP